MNETPEVLQRRIEASHEALDQNLAALEVKAKEIVDWRVQFERHPLAVLGAAFGGGLLLAATLGGGRGRRPRQSSGATMAPSPSRESSNSGQWDRLRGALGAVAAKVALDVLHEAAPSFKTQVIDPLRVHLSDRNESDLPVERRFSRARQSRSPSSGFNAPETG